MRVNRSLLYVLCLPLVALAVVGIPLLAVRLTAHQQPSAAASPAAMHGCARQVLPPHFAGVAVNPPLPKAINSFTAATHVHPALVEFYTAFGSPFPQSEAAQVTASRSIPFIQLNPRQAPLAKITQGSYDSYLREYATAVKKFKCQVILSFGHEMNGSWYHWGEPWTKPAQFIAAWRHIHDIFTEQHVHNVLWAWDPDHAGSAASQWWPGAEYVNWIGLDGYLRPHQTFIQIFRWQLGIIRNFTHKPVFIAESGVAPSHDQARQIAAMFGSLIQYRITGLVWFDINRKERWHLTGGTAASKAFYQGASDVERVG